MKFPTLKNNNCKFHHIETVSGGLSSQSTCENGKALGLKQGRNILFDKGFLQSRPGLLTHASNLIDASEYSNKSYSEYKATDIEVETDYGSVKMFLESFDYDISTYTLLTHFIFKDGTHFKSIPINFYRVTDDVFHIPVRTSFFKGKPKSGSGIFALVYLENRYSYTENSSRIYELDSSLSYWESIYSAYVPTVYINGRGNNYEIAKSSNQAFEGTPKFLEDLNLLGDRFHCYFSTDGRSSSFRLPYSSLSNTSVICRLYYSVESYVEWVVTEGKNTASQTLYGVSVTMTVNREKGIVSFSVPAGDYEMPLISDRNENNLRITASKNCDYSIEDLFSADSYLSYKGKLYLAAKGCIFSARETNPLYFPRKSFIKITHDKTPITALYPLGDNVIAFCEHEIYSIKTSNGAAFNSVSLLSENDSVFYEADTHTLQVISKDLGCNEGNSVCGDLKRIFWIGNNNIPYCLLNNGSIIALGNEIPPPWSSNSWGESFGLIDRSCVMFFKGNYALVLTAPCLPSSQSDTMEAYYWEFPAELMFNCGFMWGEKPRLVCSSIPLGLIFVSTLAENEDTYFIQEDFEAVLKISPINAEFQTQAISLGCENTMKRIDSMVLNAQCQNGEISINKAFTANLISKEFTHKTKLILGLCNVPCVELSFKSSKPFKIGNIDIKYLELGV